MGQHDSRTAQRPIRATCDDYEGNEGAVPSHHIVVLLLGHFHGWVGGVDSKSNALKITQTEKAIDKAETKTGGSPQNGRIGLKGRFKGIRRAGGMSKERRGEKQAS
jgi:hypothetical protein